MKKFFALLLVMCVLVAEAYPQTDFKKRFEDLRTRQKERYEKKRSEQQKKFDEFRRKQNERYVGQLRKRWKQYDAAETLEEKNIKRAQPIEYKDDSVSSKIRTESQDWFSMDVTSVLPTPTDTNVTIQVDTNIIEIVEVDSVIVPIPELDTIVIVDTTRILPDTIQVLPDTISVLPDTIQVLPDTIPLQPDTIQVLPDTISVLPDTIQVLPDTIPLQPDTIQVLPDPIPLLPDTIQVLLDTIPVLPDTLMSDSVPSVFVVNEDIIYLPEPEEQPQPMVPIVPLMQERDYVSVSLYGTLVSVAFPKEADLYLNSVDEMGIADLWEQIADTVVPSRFDITLTSCLKHREDMNLCDWAYLQLVQSVAQRRYGDTNEATIFASYIMAQSGYKIRLAYTEAYVYMLFASHHEIYRMSRYLLDGEYYYRVGGRGEHTCYISDVGYDKEQKLSLCITKEQMIDYELSDTISITSSMGWTLNFQTNMNLISFYEDYPTGNLFGGEEYSKWLVGVNTPLDAVTKSTLYPQLKDSTHNLTHWEAVSNILNLVQTGFTYALDNEEWGGDRIFFADETLYYPKSDCEDRAILFSILVRDILGLDVILIYYDNPAHLAVAVHFPEEEKEGVYFTYNDKRYILCDPTYQGAPIGKEMPYYELVQGRIIVID